MQISNKDNGTVGLFVHIVWLCTLCAHCLHCVHCVHCVHAHCALVTAARPDFPHHSQSALEAVSLCKQSQQEEKGEEEEEEEEEEDWTKKDLQIIDMNVCSFSMNDSLVQKKLTIFPRSVGQQEG